MMSWQSTAHLEMLHLSLILAQAAQQTRDTGWIMRDNHEAIFPMAIIISD